MSVESNIFIPMQSTNQGSIISVRTLDAQMQTVSSGGGHTHSAAQQSVAYHHEYNRVNTWNHTTLSVSTAKGKTTSFMSIHQEVAQTLLTNQEEAYSSSSIFTSRRNSDREDQLDDSNTATGQEKPGSPVGDMLLPMLVMALVYVVVKLFRNRKTTQVL